MTEVEFDTYVKLKIKVNNSRLDLNNFIRDNENNVNIISLKKIIDNYKHNVDDICIFLGNIREKYYKDKN